MIAPPLGLFKARGEHNNKKNNSACVQQAFLCPMQNLGQKEGGRMAAQEEENNHNGLALATASLPPSPYSRHAERETG